MVTAWGVLWVIFYLLGFAMTSLAVVIVGALLTDPPGSPWGVIVMLAFAGALIWGSVGATGIPRCVVEASATGLHVVVYRYGLRVRDEVVPARAILHLSAKGATFGRYGGGPTSFDLCVATAEGEEVLALGLFSDQIEETLRVFGSLMGVPVVPLTDESPH